MTKRAPVGGSNCISDARRGFCKNSAGSHKTMPFLRSQTRASFTDTSTDSVKVKSTRPTSSVSDKSNVSTATTCSIVLNKSKTSTMFPFPPAPMLPVKSQTKLDSKIINVSNVSSEASACSDISSLSIQSSSASSPSFSYTEEHSLSLNTAMVQQPQLNLTSSSVQEPAIPATEPTKFPLAQADSTSPALLQQSLMLSTTPMVYIPVMEQPSIHADRDRDLQLILMQHQCYEYDPGMDLRNKIICELDTLVKQWIRSEGLRQAMNWSQVEQVGGQVVSYGSYKLQVVDKESDLDLLCVVPKHVTREDFFEKLYEQLAKRDEVTDLRKLPWVFVPVIKMKYRGVEVDLTMARLIVH